MSMSRQTAKAFMRSLSVYNTVKELVAKAVDPVKPSMVRNHAKNRDKLDESFYEVCYNWETWKEDLGLSDTDFNETEDNIAKYNYNDSWMEKFKEDYCDIAEKSEQKLTDGTAPAEEAKGSKVAIENEIKLKQDKKFAETLADQIEALTTNISASIDKINSEVIKMDDGGESPARIQSLKSDLHALDDKIDSSLISLINQYINLLNEQEVLEKKSMKTEFINKEKPRIANLLLILSQKVKDISPSAAGNSHSTHDKKDQTTFLKKAEPPKWTGDPIDFADFMRRWKSQVSTAKLPPESELDRLRENIPTQASKALFGEKEMKTAWKILENLYGDKDIIANKLKAQLKNIKIKGKVDHDIVIELVTDVNNIVLRLRAIEMEEILHVDSEFLSAVYIALPSDFKKDWLKFDKSCFRSKWAGFIKFLELARNQALQNKVLLTNYEQNDAKIICRKCGGSGHVAKECPTNTAKINNTNFNQVEETSEEKKKEKRKARDDCGNCPLCKGRHTYYRSRQKDQWPSDRLYRCEAFSNLSVKERAQNIEKFGCCPKCTAWSHKAADCKSVTKCGKMRNGNKCNAEHSFLLCGSGNAYCGALRTTFISSSSSSNSRDSSIADRSSSADGSSSSLEDLVFSESSFPDVHAETMLLFQDVKVLGADDPAKLCWDGGSTRCLVTHQYAKACRMHAQDIVYRLDVIGSQGNPEQGCFYQFEIGRNDGSVRKMWAYGIEKIMEPPEPIDLSSVRNLFPHLPGEIFLPFPKKPVDILVGNNFLQEHPSGGNGRDSVGDMRAYQSWYGSGWVLAGSHPSLIPGKAVLSTSAHHLARIYKCDIAPQLLPSFWEADCLGVLPSKRCGKCLRCLQCSDLGLVHSRKDQEELEMIKNGVKLVNGQLHVNYPFKRDPHCLPNNRNAVMRMAEKQEARLVKSGHLACYNKEFLKYIDRGAVVKMSKQEMNDWKGPVNYISHHGVETDSVTTPRRIVTNSSLKNGTRSLNECLVRGPNSLNPMLNISLRFRCHDEGLVFDLTKAYNSLKTGPVEKNLRRFVWRFNPDDDWEDFAFDCVAFGDSPAANCLEIGRNMTADAGYEIDPVAAEKIKNDSYVDDNVSGGSKEEVERMKGERLADGSYSGTMRQILDVGNLKSKVFVSTGEADAAVKHLIGNKVLGYSWNATTDFMAVNFPVYLANKKRKMRTQPALTEETLGLLESTPLTKRICLGITNGFLDFMGISCPFTLRFKLLMRQLFESQNKLLKWEDKVPMELSSAWKELIAEAVKSSSLCFPRCVRPAGAVGLPLVVGFADGAFPAFSASIYLQWQVPCTHGQLECGQDYEATLLWAKARVTPLNGYTVPRSELSGLVLESRLALTTVKALQTESSMKPKGVILLSDSECSISALDTTSRALKPFFQNRVSEVKENLSEMKNYCPVEDIFHVPGDQNPADLATRGTAAVSDLGPESFWQKGPSFLCSGRDLWPVSRDFVRTEIPDDEVRMKPAFLANWRANVLSEIRDKPAFLACYKASILSCSKKVDTPKAWISIQEVTQYSNSIKTVLRILARLIKGWNLKGSNETITAEALGEPNASELESAERLLLLSAMPETATAGEEGRLLSLCPERDGCIIVSRGRIGEKSLSRLLGVPHLPILMPGSRAAYLYMVRAHEGEYGTVHNSVVETLARSREKVWIVKARNLAKKVCSQCPLCRRRNKKMAGQQMAKIKEESLTMCRPFTYISLDFAGPLKVKGAVNARAKMKCWIVVYCCRSTKAVELMATCGYDTQSFLLKHEEFIARHAAPASVVSDRGSQLVSAGMLLAQKASSADKESPLKWDWTKITRENSASNWIFVPIGSPHFNGLPEATVKVLKKTLDLALHPGIELTYPELVTLLAKISYTVNSRPLGLTSVSPSSQQEDHMMPLTPNMMLLARSSNYSPPLEYSGDDRFCARLAYVAQVEKEWWDRWVKQVLPTLFSYRKWKDKQKNIEVGDLVMIRYPGQFKDDYCMAKVKEVHPGEDGLVRQVTVCYKKKNTKESPTVYKSKPLITEKVAVHRLHKLHLSDDVVQEGAGKPDDGQGEQDEVDAQPVAGLAYVRVDVQGDEVMCEDVRQRHDSEIIHLAYGNAVVQADAGKGGGDVQGHCNEGVHREDAKLLLIME